MRKCLCADYAERQECHEICAHAGHISGVCDECEQDKNPMLDPWEALEEGYDIEWDG